MPTRDRVLASVARQLGHPRGPLGRLTGALLNRGNRSTVGAAADALDLLGRETVADLGFGGGVGLGSLLRKVPHGHVIGVDRSATMVSAAARRYRVAVRDGRLRLEQGELERLPLPANALDAAITLNTFYFVADLDAVVAEMARTLRFGGQLVVGLGDPAAMAKMPFTGYGFRLRPVDEVAERLAAHGLAVRADRRLGNGPDAYHLLEARNATA
jgi:ubiquinone/menaquinone biosynthesis C-methylase UbiE